jgi:hypothetical protein
MEEGMGNKQSYESKGLRLETEAGASKFFALPQISRVPESRSMHGSTNNRVHFVDALLKSRAAMHSPRLATCSQYLLLRNFVVLIQIIYDEPTVLQIPCHCQFGFFSTVCQVKLKGI